ncbi:MAG: prepilin-type N-terminal cleavage/methylation domain-containing protein [Firmicutes bacterium]|nr:prepilin-type N-terminal cleavage/methylation domain-containing protein [Bacillota bacterium]
MKSLNNRKGITLPELLIYAFLFGIILTGIYGIFISSMKYYRVTEARTIMHQNAMNSMANLFSETPGAKSTSVVIGSAPSGLYFLSARKSDGSYEFDSTGKIKWQRWVCYYLKQETNGKYSLMRKEAPLSLPTANPGACPYSTVTAFANSTVSADTIATGIQSMTIAKQATGNYSFEIIFDQTTDTTKPNRLQVATRIQTRN